MGAFSKRNKQAELKEKMRKAKEQKRAEEPSSSKPATPQEIKEANDRKRFEELLNSDAATVAMMDEFGETSFQSKSQEEKELMLAATRRLKKDRLFEGDPAPSEPFEQLVNSDTDTKLGPKGTTSLLPWLGSATARKYLAVLCDPRSQSAQLRESVKEIEASIPIPVLKDLIVVNADTPLENKKFCKKSNIQTVQFYSDESKEWMKEYTALGDERWSMTLYILADGKIQKLIREVDPIFITKIVTNAVKSVS